MNNGRIFMATPGPTNVPDRVLRAMHRACEDFAGPEFTGVAKSCHDDLARVFKTAGACFIFISNGHGAWEIPLLNLLEPGDRVLVPLAGRFSQAWAEMAERLGLEVVTTPTGLTRAIDPQAVEDALRADVERKIKAVLTVHAETASSSRTDLRAVRAAIDAAGHPALYIVDAIASLAIEAFEMDAWGIDFALAASQKGLMMPPGLAVCAINDRAMAVAEACTHPRRYWDLQFRRGDESYMWFHGTPPLQQIWGMRESLDMLFEEGLDNVVARHARFAGAARAAIARWSMGGAMQFQIPEPAERANGVTAIRVTGADIEAMRRLSRDRYNVALGAGLGELNGQVFRIGHMGNLNEPMLLGTLAVVELVLGRSGVHHRPGGVEAAIKALADKP